MRLITVNKRQKSKAFTLIELALTIIVISLTYMTVSPAIFKFVNVAKSKEANSEITEIQSDIDTFLKDNGRYPDSLEEVFGEIPLDSWGNPYQYLNHANENGKGKLRKDKNLVPINSDYDLYSMGPDGKTATPLTAAISQDDIIRGRNGLFVGLASDY
jgi:general secretion pathway protein G